MNNTLLISFVLLATVGLIGRQTTGKCITKPVDTQIVVNHTTFFNCSTDLQSTDIFWFHGVNYIYTGTVILEPYHERFEIDRLSRNGTHYFNLVIHSVQPGDAGEYICTEDEGAGEKNSAQLIVLQSDPVCRSNMELNKVIGQNTCNIKPDEVKLECSVTYYGNIRPHMEWRKVGETNSTLLEVSVVTSRNHFASTLRLRGDIALNNTSYVCETKRPTEEPIKCTSNIINVLYAVSDIPAVNKTIDDEVHCSANTSQYCNYTWKWLQDSYVAFESSTSVLKARRPGWHRCEVEYQLRNKTCNMLIMRAFIDGEKTTESCQTEKMNCCSTLLAVAFAGVYACGLLLGIIFIVIRRGTACFNVKPQPREPPQQTEQLTLLLRGPPERCNQTNDDGSADIANAFEVKVCIGRGETSDIFGPVQYKGKQCACKRIMLIEDLLSPTNDRELIEKEKILNNGRQWMNLDNENLIKFYNVVEQPLVVCIVMEFAPGGSVRKALNILNIRRVGLPTEVVLDWARQIAKGMNYLHQKDIVHRNLKCAQILIMQPFDPSTAEEVTLKVSNFSLTYDMNKFNFFNEMLAWTAPEVISEGQFSKYSDTWSYGVTVWEILTSEIPYRESKFGHTVKGLLSGQLFLKIPDSCPPVLRDILTDSFNRVPTARPSFGKILTSLGGSSQEC